MSLSFTGNDTDKVTHSAGASIDSLSTWTALYWIKINTFHTWTTFLNKNGDRWIFTAGNGEWSAQTDRNAGLSQDYYETTGANLGTGTWYFLAASYNSAAAAGERFNLYQGTLSAIVAEESYNTTNDGSGAVNDDSGGDLIIGNSSVGNDSFPCDIAFFAHYDTNLSQVQIRMQQFNIWYPVVAHSNCKIFCNYGFYGTGTQADWSGNGNSGAVTGATVAAHVPLGPASGGNRIWEVAAGRTTKNTDTHPLGIHTAMSWRLPTAI
jgi:hypothetical protein